MLLRKWKGNRKKFNNGNGEEFDAEFRINLV